MPTPIKHSRKYSPSKSSIWINCPLSTLFNDGSSQVSSPQAEFGTQCHELGAALIIKSLELADYDNEFKTIEEVIMDLDMYSPEMQEIADGYADFVISTADFEMKHSDGDTIITVEQHLDMDFDEDAGGTLDCGIISKRDGGTLTVIDLKTGRVPVQTFDSETGRFNSQLGIYALYFYKLYKDIYPIKNVRLVVYQPVINNTNDYEMSIDELLQFEQEVLIPAVAETKKINPAGKPGSHCKYCNAKATCGLRAEAMMEVFQTKNKPVTTLTDKDIEAILPYLDDMIQYAKDVMEFAMKKAMNGHRWQNYKLVHAKGARKIIDEDGVIKACESAGVDPYAPKKVAGISELTKRIGKDKVNALIGQYVEMQLGSLTLVKNSDPREEANIKEEGDL
jgi:hypothetical protein